MGEDERMIVITSSQDWGCLVSELTAPCLRCHDWVFFSCWRFVERPRYNIMTVACSGHPAFHTLLDRALELLTTFKPTANDAPRGSFSLRLTLSFFQRISTFIGCIEVARLCLA
jgi:hypothetical protein